jgi:uncharacterized protein (TIRG00374 family)
MDRPPPGDDSAGEQATEKSPTRKILGLVLRAVVSAALLITLATRIDIQSSFGVIRLARLELILLLFAMLVVERLFVAYRWHVLLSCSRYAAPMASTVRVSFMSTFLGLFLPGGVGVEAFRVYGLARQTSNLAMSLTTVLVDRVLGFFMLVMLVLIGLGLAPTGLYGQIAPWAWLALGVVVAGTAIAMLPRSRRVISGLVPRALEGLVSRRLQRLYECLDLFWVRPGVMAWVTVLALGFQLFRVAIPLVAAAALHLQAPVVYFIAFVPIINFLGMLPISLGGLGVREAGYVFFFGTVGMNSEAAFSMSILIYVLGVAATLPGACFLLTGLRRREG